jgi:hypothetical protein
MRRSLLILVALGLAIVAAAVATSGRRAPVFAFGGLLGGAVVAFGATLLVDCGSCRTDALIVGAFASLPFFGLGLVACVATPPGAGHRGLLGIAIAAMLFQIVWSALLVWVATLHGECPCAGLLVGGAASELKAIGSDRLSGPIFLAEALLALLFASAAMRRA